MEDRVMAKGTEGKQRAERKKNKDTKWKKLLELEKCGISAKTQHECWIILLKHVDANTELSTLKQAKYTLKEQNS